MPLPRLQAGSTAVLLQVSLVDAAGPGDVVVSTATRSTNGLVVPLRAAATRSLRLASGAGQDVPVVPGTGLAGVPAARVGGVLLGVTAVGDGAGTVTVHAPGAAAFANPLAVAGAGASRSTLAVTGALAGVVRVDSSVGARLRLTPQALVLNG